MKFKSIFILFSLVVLILLALVSFIPFLIFDASVAGLFWRANWPFVLILFFVLGGLDAFYFINRRLFSLLEREDWPALVNYLEGRVIRRGKYSSPMVRLLANTYLILSDSPAVMRLENRVALAKPPLIEANVLIFGTARILGKDISGAVLFFSERLDRAKPALRPWVRWYYGFSLLLDRQFGPAADQFVLLARESGDPIITGLSAYFLTGALYKGLPERRAEFDGAASAGRDRVRKTLPGIVNWRKEAGRLKTEVYAAILSKYLDEAGPWLYG